MGSLDVLRLHARRRRAHLPWLCSTGPERWIALIIGNAEHSSAALKGPEIHARAARAALRQFGLASVETWASQEATS